MPETATYPASAPAAADLPADITDDTDSKAGTPRTGTVGFLATLLSRAGVELRAVISDLIAARGSFTDIATRLNARITVRKTADQTLTTTTLANISDLSFALAANTDYSFEFWLPHSTGAAMGSGWAITASGTVTRINYTVEIFGHVANSATGTDTAVVGFSAASGTKISNTPTAGLTTTAARIRGNVQQGATGGTLQVQGSRGGGATAVNVVVFKGADGWLQAA